jgi:general secretion pathway protein G
MSRGGSASKRQQRGIKLWEVILVLAISSVIVIVISVIVLNRIDTALKEQIDTDIHRLSMALHQYKLDNKRYPSTEQGLFALYAVPTIEPIADKWNGPYINRETLLLDPWKNAYLYISSDAPPGFEITCLGADAKIGGSNQNADVSVNYQSDEH